MNYQLLAIFTGWWIVGVFIGGVGEQIWIGSDQVDIANAMLGFKIDQVAAGGGFFGMMRVGISFFTIAIPRMALFDYQFFQGDWNAMRFIMVIFFGGPLIFVGAREFLSSIMGIWRR